MLGSEVGDVEVDVVCRMEGTKSVNASCAGKVESDLLKKVRCG